MKSWPTVLGWAAISSLTLLRTVLTAAIFSGANPDPLSLLNASALDVPIDRRFKIRERPSANLALNEISYKMVALQFMANLALRDWDSTLPGALSPLPPQCPEVAILRGPEPSISGEQIPVRFLIWALNLAMYRSIARSRYVETTFDILWEDKKIGLLGFRQMLTSPPLESPLAKLPQTNHSSNVGEVAVQPIHIEVQTLLESKLVIPNNVWLLLYAAMQHLAWNDKRTVLSHAIDIAPRSTNVAMQISGDNGPGCPKRSPPFLQYSTIVEALIQLPVWMLSEGIFREVAFGITPPRNTLRRPVKPLLLAMVRLLKLDVCLSSATASVATHT